MSKHILKGRACNKLNLQAQCPSLDETIKQEIGNILEAEYEQQVNSYSSSINDQNNNLEHQHQVNLRLGIDLDIKSESRGKIIINNNNNNNLISEPTSNQQNQKPRIRSFTDFSIDAIIGLTKKFEANSIGSNSDLSQTNSASTPTASSISSLSPQYSIINPFTYNTISAISPNNDNNTDLQPTDLTVNPKTKTSPSGTSNTKVKRIRAKRYKCPHCWVALSNSGQYKGHLRTHTGERPFHCDFPDCGKQFTRNEELTRHKRIHTGLKPYPCSQCQKHFGRKDHLKKHTKTHLKKLKSL